MRRSIRSANIGDDLIELGFRGDTNWRVANLSLNRSQQMVLNLANHNALQLTLEFVTERILFLARTGSGKSGGMWAMAEEMIRAGQFVVFLDPKGDAWGIRAAGEGLGLPALIMGGEPARTCGCDSRRAGFYLQSRFRRGW
jgi:hypothetical protein